MAILPLTAGVWVLLAVLLDWITATKLVALGWVLALAPMAWIPDITARLPELQLAGRTPLLLSYVAMAVLSIAALLVVPFLGSWPLRATTSVVLLAGFLLDQALQVISGQHPQPDLVPVLISEREMATTVVPTYLPAVLPVLAAGTAILAVFALPVRRWARSYRAAAVPVVAWLGSVGLSWQHRDTACTCPRRSACRPWWRCRCCRTRLRRQRGRRSPTRARSPR